jgi:hypothetical protein
LSGYYRPALGDSAVLYVQEEDLWQSYAPGGVRLKKGCGPIPETTLTRLTEIDEAEAQLFLQPPSAKSAATPAPQPEIEIVPIPWPERIWLVLRGVTVFAIMGALCLFNPRLLIRLRQDIQSDEDAD